MTHIKCVLQLRANIKTDIANIIRNISETILRECCIIDNDEIDILQWRI